MFIWQVLRRVRSIVTGKTETLLVSCYSSESLDDVLTHCSNFWGTAYQLVKPDGTIIPFDMKD